MSTGRILERRKGILRKELSQRKLNPKEFISRGLNELAELVVEYGDTAFQNRDFCEKELRFIDIMEYIRQRFPLDYDLMNQSPYLGREDYEGDDGDARRYLLRERYKSLTGSFDDAEGFIKNYTEDVKKDNLRIKRLSEVIPLCDESGISEYPATIFSFQGDMR
jgi:hypothetical protein